jgi:excisionase family DNA binding protein
MPIRDLTSHTARYVTIAELAEYWSVSRAQIYKRIESGALEAIKLGPRAIRIRTVAALKYERDASVKMAAPLPPTKKDLPATIGFQRVRKSGDADAVPKSDISAG